MQGRSHAWQDVGEHSPDAHSQDARLMWSFEAHIETLKEQLGKAEARAERQTAEFAERAAQVAAEHTAQLKTLEERIETLKAEVSATETQLAERATEHEANIAAERVKTEAEPLKTEAEQAKAARAIPGNEVLAAEWEKMWERANRPRWRRMWRSARAEIPKRGSADRYEWQLPSMTFDPASRPGDKGTSRPLGPHR
jgi:chromosome segregation ATPase